MADSSYSIDRNVKWVTYAGAGVPIYWLLDLRRNRLEVHTEPTGQGEQAHYARTALLGPDDQAALILDGREVGRFPVREVLP